MLDLLCVAQKFSDGLPLPVQIAIRTP